MKRDTSSIKSNTNNREESSWFVLLFFKSMWASSKSAFDEIKSKK